MANERCQCPIRCPIRSECDSADTFYELELCTDDVFERLIPSGGMAAHDPSQGTFVGQCQCRITEARGLFYLLFWMRRATKKGEIAQAMQLRILHGLLAEKPMQIPVPVRAVVSKYP